MLRVTGAFYVQSCQFKGNYMPMCRLVTLSIISLFIATAIIGSTWQVFYNIYMCSYILCTVTIKSCGHTDKECWFNYFTLIEMLINSVNHEILYTVKEITMVMSEEIDVSLCTFLITFTPLK
jgi:hypothetical protein